MPKVESVQKIASSVCHSKQLPKARLPVPNASFDDPLPLLSKKNAKFIMENEEDAVKSRLKKFIKQIEYRDLQKENNPRVSHSMPSEEEEEGENDERHSD